jgi:energy-coupling factor transport system permease protein
MSLYILLRIIALLFISSLLTLTTKPTDLNNGLEAILKPLKHIGVKVSTLTMMISIALRFIPTLINEAEKILKAQASRGVDFKEGKIGAKVMQIISLLVPMFVIAYKRAYDLADAMEARGFIPDAPRTNINLLRYRTSDYLTFGFSFALLVVTIYLRIFYAL